MIVRVGLCGFTMSMKDYPRHFPVVEVQSTFYEPPRDEVLKKWHSVTPSLEYTMKVWQLVTHAANSPVYWRLHGITGPRHTYTDAELQQLHRMLLEAQPDEPAYVLFNEMPRVGDAKRFLEFWKRVVKGSRILLLEAATDVVVDLKQRTIHPPSPSGPGRIR